MRPDHRSRSGEWSSFFKGPQRLTGAKFPPLPPGAIAPPTRRPHQPGEPSPGLANWAHGLLIVVCVLLLAPVAVATLAILALLLA